MDANEINTEKWARAAVARLLEKCRQLVADEFERRARLLRGEPK